MRFFACSLLLPMLAVAQSFPLEIEVSPAGSLYVAPGVSHSVEAEVQVVVPEVVKAPAPIKVAEPSVVLSMPMTMDVGEKSLASQAPAVRYLAAKPSMAPVLKASEAKPSALEALGEVLPPLNKELVLPEIAQPAKAPSGEGSSFLLTRDGQVVSGVDGMMDYMLDKAPAAKAVGKKEKELPSMFTDPLLAAIGGPTGGEAGPSVTVDGIGELAQGMEKPVPVEKLPAYSGFEPLPPAGYQGQESVSSASQDLSVPGTLW